MLTRYVQKTLFQKNSFSLIPKVIIPISPLSESSLKLDGGRCSESGITATVFGASGFVARYVVNRLGRIGSKVIVPFRGDGLEVRHLKLMGDIGHIAPLKYDIRDRNSINRAIGPSNVVINLASNYRETINYSYEDTNAKSAKLIAECAKQAGVERLIHVSHIGADDKSSSALFRSKALGEKLVMDAFPNATILRPAPIFGAEDRLLMRYAALIQHSNSIPLLERAQRMQPVYVDDVAGAIAAAIADPATKGRLYELGGPSVITDHTLAATMCEAMHDFDIREFHSEESFQNLLKWKQYSVSWRRWFPVDLYEQMRTDLLVKDNALQFEDLGITPSSLDDHFQHIVRVHDKFQFSTSTEYKSNLSNLKNMEAVLNKINNENINAVDDHIKKLSKK